MPPAVASACLKKADGTAHAFKQKLLAAEKRATAWEKKGKGKGRVDKEAGKEDKPTSKKASKKKAPSQPKTAYMQRKQSFLGKCLGCGFSFQKQCPCVCVSRHYNNLFLTQRVNVC